MYISACSDVKKVQRLIDFMRDFNVYTEDQIRERTGCIASCTRSEFKVELILGPEVRHSKWNGSSFMTSQFMYASSTHNLQEEYIIYNFDSFIADVGGFLGLLLGHSALSLFKDFIEWNKSGKLVKLFGCRKAN